jgi:hypothetical protein
VKRVIAGPDNWPAKSSGIPQPLDPPISTFISFSLEENGIQKKVVGSTEYSGVRGKRLCVNHQVKKKRVRASNDQRNGNDSGNNWLKARHTV